MAASRIWVDRAPYNVSGNPGEVHALIREIGEGGVHKFAFLDRLDAYGAPVVGDEGPDQVCVRIDAISAIERFSC